MVKIIWMSDLHFVAEGAPLGHDPRARLEAAIAHINAHHGDADCCVISGDLVNHPSLENYVALRPLLDRLDMPWFPMMGNHDDRALLRQTLPVPDSCMEDFVQYAVPVSGALVLALDTHKPTSGAGEFCAARRLWLQEALQQAGDRAEGLPVILFLHHPPMELGLPMLDAIRMEEGNSFLELVNRHISGPCQLCIGHVHRSVSGVAAGLPFATQRSVLFQAPPPVPAWDWVSFAPTQEDPGLGIILIDGSRITIQNESFCAYEVGTQGR
ncbi:metallophosphoesterase [Phaeobacter sp. PT47_59]|uniref:metallophosphoesterase n=1 Tax=Phaeobacter sp. PT47_59 TaxID=3029979 RepID=UPI00238034E9|nr:metallophosphoesterase [Phaeobacter sp. PT47_59]MDE4173123.1 metallophosphoesterase [Phaeobacter sp. PT47_59]